MMEAIRSFETSVLTQATRRHIPEDGIPHMIFKFLVSVSILMIVLRDSVYCVAHIIIALLENSISLMQFAGRHPN
jgi:hypothetical protein